MKNPEIGKMTSTRVILFFFFNVAILQIGFSVFSRPLNYTFSVHMLFLCSRT